YTVSPEYFTRFKFHQFSIAPVVPNRVGAAIVGGRAAWWMGLVIGPFLIPAALTLPGSRNYFRGLLWAFTVVAFTTFVIGIVALITAYFVVDTELAGQIVRYGNEMDDDVAFLRAGVMHNCSYLSGLVGIVVGNIAIFRFRRKCRSIDESAVERP
ncbi:MAG: hypothetical protein KDB27_19995, partial [Planctomycetales bacterium]|nr:hypothetical protein [Planctomycetales bacterium]